MRRLAMVALAAALALVPGTAQAQKYFGGFTGWSYDNADGECPSVWNDCQDRKTGYGVVVGGIGGLIGFEQEFGWTSNFFGESSDVEGSKVSTLMSNLLVSVPIGPLRPYGAVGVGFIKANMQFTVESLRDFSDTAFGWNYGAGAIVLLPAHLGVRLDYRLFRSGPDIPYVGDAVDEHNPLEFSRVSIGVVLH